MVSLEGRRDRDSLAAVLSGGHVKLKILVFTATFFVMATDVIYPSVGQPQRWYYHYDLTYDHSGKTWKTLDRPFSTLKECLRFVDEGPWAKGEHCDASRR
jgi:hypothetical protein